jgi:FAD-dependent urate hydroxylase
MFCDVRPNLRTQQGRTEMRQREMTNAEIAIIGAGPYGLSAAAHLRARGADVAIFGEPMSFWEHHMPAGMLLRSPYCASSIDAPAKMSLDDFQSATETHVSAPVPLNRFVEYGRWFQLQAAPDVDRREVSRIERRSGGGFKLLLQDGDSLVSSRVVVAAGIGQFALRPPEFSTLPPETVSHTVDHSGLTRFAGQRVAVIGAGQSALESAALLTETGASAEVIARGPVRFVDRRWWLHTGPVRLLHNSAEIGPAVISHLVAFPNVFTRFPQDLQDRLAARAIRPVGATWLQERLAGVPVTTGNRVIRTEAALEGGVRIELADGSARVADHVLLATGYRVDLARYAFLAPELLSAIERTDGYPTLRAGFESSVPGLHFIGAAGARSFGPFLRFVVGTSFVSPRLARSVAGKRMRKLVSQSRAA